MTRVKRLTAVRINVPRKKRRVRDEGCIEHLKPFYNKDIHFNVLTEQVLSVILQKENPTKKVGINKRGGSVKLSTKGRYGLRAMVDLAEYGGEEAVSISSISKRQGISERYLEQLMARLRKAGLVKSIRGAGGGYIVARDPDDISAGEILRALEGDLEAVSCAAFHEDETCGAQDICVTKYVWQRINESIQHTVDSIYLSQLVEESRSKKNDHKGCMATEARCNSSRK